MSNSLNLINPATLELGTVFYATWGYEQTNVNFYQLVRKSGKSLVIREVSCQTVYEGDMTGKKVPKIGEFKGEEIRKIMRQPKDYMVHDSQYIQLWDGKPKHFSSYH